MSGEDLQAFSDKDFLCFIHIETEKLSGLIQLYVIIPQSEGMQEAEDIPANSSGGGCDSVGELLGPSIAALTVFLRKKRTRLHILFLLMAALWMCIPAWAEMKVSGYTLPIPYEVYDIAGTYTLDFELTPELVNRIVEEWEDPMSPDARLQPEQVHSYSEIALPGTWEILPYELYILSVRGSYAAVKLPLAESWPGEENYGAYVVQCIFSNDVQPGEFITVWPFPVDSVTRKVEHQASGFVQATYVLLDENFNRIFYVPQSRTIYIAMFLRPQTVNASVLCVNRGLYVEEEDPVSRFSPDFAQTLAKYLSIDIGDLRYLLKHNIGQPIEPTQAMQDYVRNDNHEIIGNLPTVSVDEAGYYVIPITLNDDVFKLVRSKDVGDFKIYALNDSELGSEQMRPAFINGLLGTWELFTLNGEKLDKFSVREFLMVGFLDAGTPFSLYLAKILLALLLGGCASFAGTSILVVFLLFIIIIRRNTLFERHNHHQGRTRT